MISLLLVEDDTSLGSTLSKRLEKERYEVKWAKTCADAQAILSEDTIQIAIIDVSLPDGDGFTLARSLRIPFLFLTAMGSAEYRLEGYELGADEYILKPFHLNELLLRLSKVVESHGLVNTIESTGFNLVSDSYTIEFETGEKVQCPPKDFQLLKALVEQAPKAITRPQALEKIWASENANSRTVDNAIARLRAELRKRNCDHIHSVRGVGYQWLEK